jgi:hypothetical protein
MQPEKAGFAAMHEMHGPPGPQLLLFAALHHLDLKPDQRATIENAAHAIGAQTPIEDGLRVEVAASVRAGTIDEARVLAKLDAAGPSADRASSLAGALDTLHATLTAGQRRELVDTIGKHIDKIGAAQEAMASGATGMLADLLAKIDLTAAQRESIDRVLAGLAPNDGMAGHIEEMHADLRARLQSFASDGFDAAAFVSRPVAMRAHVARNLHALAAIVPLLDSAQREALASAIEAAPLHGHAH